jgi:L-lactate permease
MAAALANVLVELGLKKLTALGFAASIHEGIPSPDGD